MKAKNFDTLFGRTWHVINPFLFGLIYFVFVGIIGGGGFSDTGRLTLIVGNLYVWLFFAATISTGVGAVQSGAGSILSQSSIPSLVLPLSSTITATNLFARSLIAYVPLHILADRGLHLEMFWLPYLVLLTALSGLGIALLLALLNVFLRDVSRLLPHALRLWMYLSPVIWEYTRVLDSPQIARFNPMYPALTAWTMAFGGSLDPDGPSMLSQVGWFSLWTLFVLFIGMFVFIAREDEIAIRN